MATQRAPLPTEGIPVVSGMSFEEFLVAYEGIHAEWVDGEVVVMSPNSLQHSELLGFLSSILRVFVEERKLGKVIVPAYVMRIPERPLGREPDVMYVAREHLDRLAENYLDGPADLVVEVVSPDSRGRDRGEKFYEYEQAGVREYWLIDPIRQQAELYRLDERGTYAAAGPDDEGRLHSEVLPGFWIRAEWLWAEPLPTVLWVHAQWGQA